MTASLDTLITDACALKRQVNHDIAGLYRRLSRSDWSVGEAINARKVVARQYGPAINKIVAATTTEALTQRRDTLNARLHKGWNYCHLHPKDDPSFEMWEGLLVEYAVMQDALDHIGIVAQTMERIAGIKQHAVPLEQRSVA